jgi:cytochrome b pre-mRNA-processing protein 3
MIFKTKKHNSNLYITLLNLSRNIFFYNNLKLSDTYETRIYLMFFHYSVILFITKNRKIKPDQESYNNLFFCLENNLRELGFGDVSVNKKMKDLNKIFYDILIKLSEKNTVFNISKTIIYKYFDVLKNNDTKREEFELYFRNFYNFCFELPHNNMLKEVHKFKY